MSKMIKSILGVIFILIIMFCAIVLTQNIGKRLKLDITDQKIYTLSDGTRAILAKINQPIKMKLYYAETAAMKGPDQIRYYNNYYYFVRSLLQEYQAVSGGKVQLEIIDPRPYSDEESEAIRYGLRKFPITQDENFFFGLVLQTQFGIEKSISFFAPQRQSFVEYDISYLIDTAVTRQKKRIGVISSLNVMGDDVSGYMAQMMRAQGRQPAPAWGIVELLKSKYDVSHIPVDSDKVEDVDMLFVIHPKQLQEKTLFAIDQFVLNGGRAIICVDPHSMADQPDPQQAQTGAMTQQDQASDLNVLLKKWGITVPTNSFAGDRSLALEAAFTAGQRQQKIIGFLGFDHNSGCFNLDSPVTSELNDMSVLFSGVIEQVKPAPEDIQITNLLTTTNKGNAWTTENPFDLKYPDPQNLMSYFVDGMEPVVIASMITGKFGSAFPDGIEVEIKSETDETEEPAEKKMERVTGIAKAENDCAVIVFADVDFISDILAFQNSILGKVAVGDNSAIVMNAFDDMSGSDELLKIRSRGNFRRPFSVVDAIEQEAEKETAVEVEKIQAEIAALDQQLQQMVTKAQQGDGKILSRSVVQNRREVELKKHQAQKRLNKVQLQKRVKVEQLEKKLANLNMFLAPAVILLISIVLSLYRLGRKRHYVSTVQE